MEGKKVAAIVIVIILIAMLALYLSGLTQTIASIAGGCNYNVLSLSKVKFLSNDPELNKDAFLTTIVQGSGSSCVVGDFPNEKVNDELQDSGDDEKAKFGFKLTVDSTKQQCVYTIKEDSSQRIYTLKVDKTKSCSKIEGGCEGVIDDWLLANSCNMLYSHYITWGIGLLHDTRGEAWCVKKVEQGITGRLGYPLYNSEVYLKIEKEGQPFSYGEATVSGKVKEAALGDKAYAYFDGYLVSGLDCPSSPQNTRGYAIGAFYSFGHNKWITNTLGLVDYYYDELNDYVKCIKRIKPGQCTPSPSCERSEIDACVRRVNEAVTPMQRRQLIDYEWAVITQREIGPATGGSVVLDVDKPLKYPVITLHIDAKWLGVYIPIGECKVMSTTGVSLKSGQTGYVIADIKNAGQETTVCNTYMECPSPFESYTSLNPQLLPRQVKSVELDVTGTTLSSKVCKKCVVYSNCRGMDKPSSREVDVCVSKIDTHCVPEKQMECIGGDVMRCNSQGNGYNLETTCPNGCEYVNAQPTCRGSNCDNIKDGICPSGNACPADPDCNVDIWKKIFDFLQNYFGYIALVILIAILAYLGYKKQKEGRT